MAGEIDLLPLRPCTHVLGVDQANGGRAGLLSVATLAARSAAAMHTQREMDRLAALGIPAPTLLMQFEKEAYYQDGAGGAAVSSDLLELLAARGGSFARASGATYYGADGALKTAASNVPRLDYDPSRARRGLLVEGATTNRAYFAANNNSETVGSSPAGVLTPLKGYTAPDGSNNASLITEDTSNGEHFVSDMNYTVAVGDVVVYSTFVKAAPSGAARHVGLRFSIAHSRLERFDPSTGTFVGGSAAGRGVEVLAGGWYRVWISNVMAAAGGLIARIQLHDASGHVYTGDGASGMLIWGRQVESQSAPSSYIPALTAPTARAADNCSINYTDLINPIEGTLVFDVTADTLTLGTNNIFATLQRSAAGLGGDSIYLTNNSINEWQIATYRAGANQTGAGISFSGAAPSGQREKFAVTFKDGLFRGCRNGGTVIGRTGFLMPAFAGACNLLISNNSMFGWHHKHTYIPAFVSDAQLQSLTAA